MIMNSTQTQIRIILNFQTSGPNCVYLIDMKSRERESSEREVEKTMMSGEE